MQEKLDMFENINITTNYVNKRYHISEKIINILGKNICNVNKEKGSLYVPIKSSHKWEKKGKSPIENIGKRS